MSVANGRQEYLGIYDMWVWFENDLINLYLWRTLGVLELILFICYGEFFVSVEFLLYRKIITSNKCTTMVAFENTDQSYDEVKGTKRNMSTHESETTSTYSSNINSDEGKRGKPQKAALPLFLLISSYLIAYAQFIELHSKITTMH